MRFVLFLLFVSAFCFRGGNSEDRKDDGVSISWISEDTGDPRPLIYKCKCGANQVLIDDKCVDQSTSVYVIRQSSRSYESVNTSTFGRFVVKPLSCSSDMKLSTLYPIIFFENGYLYSYQNKESIRTDMFCIEYEVVNKTTQLYAHVCAEKPTVTQCCPKGFILDSTFKCIQENNFQFEPTFSNGISWENPVGVIHKIEKCQDGFKLESVNVSDQASSSFSLSTSDTNEAKLSMDQKEFEIELILDSSEFCIAARKMNTIYFYEAFFCREDAKLKHERICFNSTCIQKCCPVGNAYYSEHMVCLPTTTNTSFPFLADHIFPNSTYAIVTGAPFCNTYVTVDASHEPSFLENGFLHVKQLSQHYSPGQYCVENVDSGDVIQEKAFICPHHGSDNCGWRYTLVSVLLGISSVFLLVTLVVYVGIKDLRSRMSGKCLISEIASLIVCYVTLIAIQGFTRNMSLTGCHISGIILHISILASFFWLNVMCFDVWSTIRSHRPMDDESRTRRTFIYYSIYGWGSPLLIGVVAILVDNLPKENKNVLRPGFGEGSCFFSGPRSQWLYMYGIVLVLLLSNIGFFVHTVFTLDKARRESEKFFNVEGKMAGGTNRAPQERMWMYAKLFMVMGLSWLAEVISFQMETSHGSCFYWILTDVMNALRGIFIFSIFVCKKTTLKKIESTWRPEKSSSKTFRASSKTRISHTPSAYYTSMNQKVSMKE